MTYKVLQLFTDGETGLVYNVGDTYPATGSAEPTAARVQELLGDQHPNHVGPIIAEEVDKEADDKPTADNTVAEIKAYLQAHDIAFSDKANKTELLKLI